jgi:Predicted acetyltransferase
VEARILTPADEEAARIVVSQDPIQNVFVGSRIDAGVLSPGAPGLLWGWPAQRPDALLHCGANLAPVARNLDPVPAFVEAAGRRRTSQSIVGPSWLVMPYWRALGARWGRSYDTVREVRSRQPVMAISGPPRIAPDPRLRPIRPAEFGSYFHASVAMYTEEVGSDPGSGADSGYRSYCWWLVEQGRAFGIVEDGRVIFKADIGATNDQVAQIQGVWLDPVLRGHGLSSAAMAAVVEYVLADFAVASLYVNDFNVRAVRSYLRTGFEQVGEFATILY